MAKETTVAPKERVNITYRPATGDAQSEVELPLKMVMLGDYTLREDETPLEDRKRISIDKDNFNDVLSNMNVSVDLSVDDKLSGEKDSNIGMSLSFNHIRDFDPDRIVSQVPELQKMQQLRDALSALRGPLGNVPAFRKNLQAILGDKDQRDKLLAELTLGGED